MRALEPVGGLRRDGRALNDALDLPCPVWLKVDVGYGRAGVKWRDEQGVLELVRQLEHCERLDFVGLLSHSGHTYACRGREEVNRVFDEGRERMIALKAMLAEHGIIATVSLGDTPSASLAENFEGVDEMRPGNFVFYDLDQSRVGSCETDDIAAAVACPVIGRYEDEAKLLVYGGSVHLSKDSVTIDDQRHFGQLALPTNDGWRPIALSESHVFGCCQEVSQIKLTPALFEQIELGQTVYILPAHACLAADIYPHYFTTDGKRIPRFSLYRS